MPVFFGGPDAGSLLTIYSGARLGGVVEVLDIYNDVPRTLAPTASKGMLDLLIAHVSDFGDPSQGDETRIYSQSETITEASSFSVISRHVINGVAYLIALRTHRVTHQASVSYQYFSFQGQNGLEFGPVGPVLNQTRDFLADAVYDVVAFAVDLESGEVASNAEVVYQYAATITGFAPYFIDDRVLFQATETRTPTPLAIANLLPAVHPFRACGASIWSVNAVDPAPTIESGYMLAAKFAGFFTLQVSRSFNTLLGLNTDSERRIISKSLFVNGADQVLELSTYQNNSGSACALYQDIALAWADSYSTYAPAEVLDREDVFADVSGLSPADQQLFLSTIYEPPADILPGASTAGATIEPTYFMATNTLNQLSIAANQSLTLRYWIAD